jgi:hydrogenase maturation factor
MTEQRISDLTTDELKALVTSTIDERLSAMKASLLQEIADLMESKVKSLAAINGQSNSYKLPKLTEAERQQKLKDLQEMFRRWDEEYDEEEQRETFEYLQRVLDEDRLSNRPLLLKIKATNVQY